MNIIVLLVCLFLCIYLNFNVLFVIFLDVGLLFFSIELFKIINKLGLKLHIGSGSEPESTGSKPVPIGSGFSSRIYENLKPVDRSIGPVLTEPAE